MNIAISSHLEDYTEITLLDYIKLDNPNFEGQTRIDPNGYYYMCWSIGDKLYKTKNKL